MIPVFIGGSGRSGTSILKQILAAHPGVVSVPGELRIIVDPEGALDLFSALTRTWSPYAADHAISRFRDLLETCATETLMQKIARLFLSWTGISPGRYAHCAIGSQFGEAFYRQRLQQLLDQLVSNHANGYWIGSPSYQSRPVIQEAGPFRPEDAAEIISSFFDDLYRHLAGPAPATHWVDDTPFNILHGADLLGLFPQLRLVHIYRHPLDVVASYRTKAWGGSEAGIIAIRLSNILQRWKEVRETLPDNTFMEIKLETLFEDPEDRLAELCTFIGINMDERLLAAGGALEQEKAHIGRWENDLSQAEAEQCRQQLSPFMDAYGYA